MGIEKNTAYACRVVRINDNEVDYLSELVIDEECFTTIAIKDIERNGYNMIKNELHINIVVKLNAEYLTIVDCQLIESSSRVNHDCSESIIDLKYISSLLLIDYFSDSSHEIKFNGFNCEITETTELLGVYPYQIDYDEFAFPQVECDIKGNVVAKEVGCGFSYFVAPSIVRKDGGLRVSMYGKIQFSSSKEENIEEIRELLNSICLFFEILSGEIVTIEDVYLKKDRHSVKAIGLGNFHKNKLNGLQSGVDSRSFLRKSIFKVSDFEDSIGQAIDVFREIKNECMLACEAYKQILLDEEVKIGTYNKFLKAMQIVEGFQRVKIDESEEEEFKEKKNKLMDKLDEIDKAFVDKYTSYNGQSFRICINEFTMESIHIISGLSVPEAKKTSKTVIDSIINDRNVYTHASKEIKPILPVNKLHAVSYCYKIFFRILILSKMGLEERIIRNRLLFDRKFVAYYKLLFGLEINREGIDTDTGEFDKLMW